MGYDNDARRRNRYVGSVVSLFEKLASLPLLLPRPPPPVYVVVFVFRNRVGWQKTESGGDPRA